MALRSVPLPTFDHGAALRVPPAHDTLNWNRLLTWLGEAARPCPQPGSVAVRTRCGLAIASPGDWIVLSVKGDYHVAIGGSGDGMTLN